MSDHASPRGEADLDSAPRDSPKMKAQASFERERVRGSMSEPEDTPTIVAARTPKRRKSKSRVRTQSEGAVWARSSLTMLPRQAPHSMPVRNSEGASPSLTAELLDALEAHGRPSVISEHDSQSRSSSSSGKLGARGGLAIGIENLSREGCILMWRQQGEISERASEILEDAKLSLHGRERDLYSASARRLSASQDPLLSSLGEKMASFSSSPCSNGDPQGITPSPPLERGLSNGTGPAIEDDPTSADADAEASQLAGSEVPGSFIASSLDFGKPTPADQLESSFRAESATLYHEAVRWEGVLSRRSEWLRRLEKHYYVLEGKYLRRFASKQAYLSSRDEPFLSEAERAKRGLQGPTNAVSHLYIIAGVKDSSARVNGFTYITEDKKTLQLIASTPVEKVIWMRLALEAIVAIPNLPVAPLDMEEFYAMLVVLYTAHSGKWRTEGDMAVTLPPPSEQVFTRFFRLLDKNIIFCSSYPPSVPFHGSYRGHAGVVNFMHEFAKHTNWTNFKIAGLSVEGAIAVASGQEDLENKRDGRRFVQNWVHKFMFFADGRLTRFEINGDVVAASAVFKVPGAATTLKLPQEFNEVDVEHGIKGTLLVHVMQGSGLKTGVNNKNVLRQPAVVVSLHHQQPNSGDKPQGASTKTGIASTALSSISMPAALTRRFPTGLNLFGGGSNSSTPSSAKDAGKANPFSTGVPRNVDQNNYSPANPVWNKVVEVPFENLIGVCSLVLELTDRNKSYEVKIGLSEVNVAKYIMSSRAARKAEEDAAMASDARWYTISNLKGEYCGKIKVGMTCRCPAPDTDPDPVSRRVKSYTMVDPHNPPSSQMLQWDGPGSARLQPAMTPVGPYAGTPAAIVDDSNSFEHRRHGWANVKLSPERANRPLSDGATAKIAKQNATTTTSRGRFDAVECKENADMHTFMVCSAPFTIPKHYELIKVCGRGAYGVVIAATDTMTGGNVAIKKVIDCIWHPHQLKQILRESRLMRHLSHENILSLMDLIPPPSYFEFRDVYMTVDLMEMDLHRIIYSKEVLLDDHIRYFLYQILSGLNHMHKAGVLHRDLKPSNLLINSDCQLKICDLGLARTNDVDDNGMTEYVVTRWYRAPELLLGSAYGEGVDLWAAGCIFAEMLGRKPLFPGETYVHQLQLIMNVLGVPEEHSFKENPQANKLKGRQLLSRTQAVAGIDVSTMFPNANPEGLDLLWKMLVFDVEKRMTVEEALRHPYLAMYYDDEKENAPVERFESFDLDGLDESELKELMFKEICHFHPEEMEKRAKQMADNPESIEKLPPGWVKRESRSVPGKFYYSNPKRGISTWVKEEMD